MAYSTKTFKDRNSTEHSNSGGKGRIIKKLEQKAKGERQTQSQPLKWSDPSKGSIE